MAYVYILKSLSKDKFYVGSTDNLDRRPEEHNSGLSYYTKRFIPWRIVYQEKYDNIGDAIKREKYLKSAAGRRFIKKQYIPR